MGCDAIYSYVPAVCVNARTENLLTQYAPASAKPAIDGKNANPKGVWGVGISRKLYLVFLQVMTRLE